MIKKVFFAASISLSAFSAYCSIDNISLAKQCHLTSQQLQKLENIQVDDSCKIKIGSGTVGSDLAGEAIINEEFFRAKEFLKLAISALKYVEIMGCEGLAEIVFAKTN